MTTKRLRASHTQLKQLIRLLQEFDNESDKTQPLVNYTVFNDGSVRVSLGDDLFEHFEIMLVKEEQ